MQYRMKTHQLSAEVCFDLLDNIQVGCLATVGEDGAPYALPVHFVLLDDKIYVHGLPAGEKVENIRRDPNVCLTAWVMEGFLEDPQGRPCETNTAYHSVVVKGRAHMVEDSARKMAVLWAIVAKYQPMLTGVRFPEAMLEGTGVIEIEIAEMTGKYWA